MAQASQCAYKSCVNHINNAQLEKKHYCAYCAVVYYCSINCRILDWETNHKKHCMRAPPQVKSENIPQPVSAILAMNSLNINPDSKSSLEDFEIINQNNKFTPDLGKGSFGQVKLAKKKSDPTKLFALKIINKRVVVATSNIQFLKREIKIQRKLDHPHIIRLYDAFEDKDNVYLVLEYAENGNLFNLLRKKRRFSEKEAFVYFFQASIGIDYLHKKGIIHRDLKPENLLLDSRGNVKLCDFGYSAEALGKRNTFCGTVDYMAPEVIEKKTHNYKVDIWSLGVLLYELTHGYPPFKGFTSDEKFKSIVSNEVKVEGVSEDVKDLIKKLLKSDPEQRLDFKNIFEHSWLKKHESEFHIDIKSFIYQPQLKMEGDISSQSTGDNSQPSTPKKEKIELPTEMKIHNISVNPVFKPPIQQEKENDKKLKTPSPNERGHKFFENSGGQNVKETSKSPDTFMKTFEKSNFSQKVELGSKDLPPCDVGNQNNKNMMHYDSRKKGVYEPKSLSNSPLYKTQNGFESKCPNNTQNLFTKNYARTPDNKLKKEYEPIYDHKFGQNQLIRPESKAGVVYLNDGNIVNFKDFKGKKDDIVYNKTNHKDQINEINAIQKKENPFINLESKQKQNGNTGNRRLQRPREDEFDFNDEEENNYDQYWMNNLEVSKFRTPQYKTAKDWSTFSASQAQNSGISQLELEIDNGFKDKISSSKRFCKDERLHNVAHTRNVSASPIKMATFKLDTSKEEESVSFDKINSKNQASNINKKKISEDFYQSKSARDTRHEQYKKEPISIDLITYPNKDQKEESMKKNKARDRIKRSKSGHEEDKMNILDHKKGKEDFRNKIEDMDEDTFLYHEQIRRNFAERLQGGGTFGNFQSLGKLRKNQLKSPKKGSDYSNAESYQSPTASKRHKSKRKKDKEVILSEVMEDLDLEDSSRISRPSYRNRIIPEKEEESSEKKLSFFAKISFLCGFSDRNDTKPSSGKTKRRSKY